MILISSYHHHHYPSPRHYQHPNNIIIYNQFNNRQNARSSTNHHRKRIIAIDIGIHPFNSSLCIVFSVNCHIHRWNNDVSSLNTCVWMWIKFVFGSRIVEHDNDSTVNRSVLFNQRQPNVLSLESCFRD